MRCRKVRSYLSAYCSDELSSRKRLTIREHLATCSGCRREEEIYLSMSEAGRQLENLAVSDDFNLKLLNRIGRERFVESRQEAYLPRRAPLFSWRHVVPVVAAVALVLVFGTVWLSPDGQQLGPQLAVDQAQVPDWISAQPTNNPNMTGALDKDWSLDKQLRRSDYMARVSNAIMDRSGFGNLRMASGLDRRTVVSNPRLPVIVRVYRMQPVIRVYQSSPNMNAGEGSQVF